MKNSNRMRFIGSIFLVLCVFGASEIDSSFRAELESKWAPRDLVEQRNTLSSKINQAKEEMRRNILDNPVERIAELEGQLADLDGQVKEISKENALTRMIRCLIYQGAQEPVGSALREVIFDFIRQDIDPNTDELIMEDFERARTCAPSIMNYSLIKPLIKFITEKKLSKEGYVGSDDYFRYMEQARDLVDRP